MNPLPIFSRRSRDLKKVLSIQKEKMNKNIGFTIRKVGIGDGIQFTSLPENFYHMTGEKLIDVSRPWYLDHNPFVIRDVEPEKTTELWNYPKLYDWPKIRDSIYLTNAEVHANVFGLRNPVLNRPRMYQFEDFPFYDRKSILFHPFGKSHGSLPDEVIDHVLKKYKNKTHLYQIGLSSEPDLGIKRIKTETMWDLVKVISECRMLIGVDSGPAWIASCFPDIVTKKIRVQFQKGYCEPQDWVPMDVKNEHSFWDDTTLFKIFNCTKKDLGFTRSYLEL